MLKVLLDAGDIQKTRSNHQEASAIAASRNEPPPEYPKTLKDYDEAHAKLTWYELRYLEEFNELSSSRIISLGGMGGALIGHITFQEIYAYLALGLSSINDPVNVYARIIKDIDNEYTAMKQKKIDDESAKASKSSGKSGGKKPFIGAPSTGKVAPLPHNID